jgi:hypothetical protein
MICVTFFLIPSSVVVVVLLSLHVVVVVVVGCRVFAAGTLLCNTAALLHRSTCGHVQHTQPKKKKSE